MRSVVVEGMRTLAVLLLIGLPLRVLADPVPASTLGWMINGVVSEVARAGDVAYVGGSFRTVAPSANRVLHNATFSSIAAVPVLPPLDLNGALRAVIALPSGGWMIAGEFTQVNGTARMRLARLTAAGTLDPTFNVAVNGTVRALETSTSVLYLGGDFGMVGDQPRDRLAAIDLNSFTVDSAFAPAVAGGSVYDLLRDLDTLYVGGDFLTIDGTARPSLAAVNATSGVVNSAFDANADGSVRQMERDGGHLYVVGQFQNIGGLARRGVGKLELTSGAGIAAFNAQMTSDVDALAVGPLSMFIGGSFTTAGGESRRNLAALDLDTGSATAWNANTDGRVSAIVDDGFGLSLFIAGSFESVDGVERLSLAGLNPLDPDNPVTTWNPALNAAADFMMFDPAGNIFVGGPFTAYGAVRRDNLAAFDLQTGELLSWNPGTNGWVRALDVYEGTVFLGGDFTIIGGVSRGRIARVDAVTGDVLNWNPNANGPVKGIMVAGSTVYFVGEFSAVGPSGSLTSRGRGAAVDVDGTVNPWNPSANDIIESLFVDGGNVYLGGRFTTLGVQPRVRLAVVDAANGAPDATFAPIVDNTIYRVDVQNSIVYFGGEFQLVNGSTRNRAAAVQGLASGTLPGLVPPGTLLNWAPDVGGPVFDLDAFGAVVYLAGGFGSVDGSPRPGIAAVDSDPATGALRSWQPADVSGGNISVIDTSDAAVLFGGALFDNDNVSIGAVLYPDASLLGAPRPPTTPDLLVGGTTLVMSWARPPLGPAPTAYVIEGGSASDLSDLANFSTGNAATTFSAAGLPPGRYFVRLRATNGFGASVASPEIAFSIGGFGCIAPPERPVDLDATGAGSTVSFRWRAPPNSIVSGYSLRVGALSGRSDLVSLPLPGDATLFTVDAPPGAYFVTLTAQNPCGVSAPSTETVVVVGNVVVPPTRPFELQSAVTSGRTVTLSWAAPSIGTGPLQYVVDVGSAPGATDFTTAPFSAESITASGVAPGIYYVRVRAIGPGGPSPASNEVVVVVQ